MSDKLQYDPPVIMIVWFAQEDVVCTSRGEDEWIDDEGPWIPAQP